LRKEKSKSIRSYGIHIYLCIEEIHFFGVELTGCLGPDAINLCKQKSNLTGEGPEGLKSIFELFSIGFQTNRA
jgi:hypothetical protein